MRATSVISFLLIVLSGCASVDKTFRTIHETYTSKLTNWILADNEASKYKDEEDAARAYLRELRAMTGSGPRLIANKLDAAGFHWHAEVLDFTSYPWVTIARKRGDCDDFMLLWESIYKDKGVTWRVIVGSKSGSGHAMLLYYDSALNRLYLLSNVGVFREGYLNDWETMVKAFYGDNTSCYIRVRSE
jgi:hypothetical protein